MTNPLPPYQKEGLCPKCGAGDVSARYWSLNQPFAYAYFKCAGQEHREHLHRACHECFYEWCEAVITPEEEA